VATVASRQGFFHLRLPNWLANRERSRVFGFCSVMIELSSCPGQEDPYATVPYTTSRLLHFNLLFTTFYNPELKRNAIVFTLM
jgi:hypothetical protein